MNAVHASDYRPSRSAAKLDKVRFSPKPMFGDARDNFSLRMWQSPEVPAFSRPGWKLAFEDG